MPEPDTTDRGRPVDDPAGRVRKITRTWTASERRQAVFWSEGAGLCRRYLILSVVFWSVLVSLAHSFVFLGWTGEAPYEHSLPPGILAVLGLGLWTVQGWLGIRAYGPFGGRPLSDLIQAGLPVWGCAWAVRRFVSQRRRPFARLRARTARPALVYLMAGHLGWLAFGLLGLTAHGGIGAWPPLLACTVLVAANLVGILGARRYWSMTAGPPNARDDRRFVSLWAWWLPIAGPLWAFWQLLEAETPGAGSSLTFQAHGSRRVASAKPQWGHARDTLGSAWRVGSWTGRWTRWRDRPTGRTSPKTRDHRFRRLCHAKKDLLFPDGLLLGWWGSGIGYLQLGPDGELVDSGSVLGFMATIWGLGALTLLGSLHALWSLLRRGPESLSLVGEHQIGGFLVSSQFTLFWGLSVGACLVQTEPRVTLQLATYAILSLLLVRVLSSLLQGFTSGSFALSNLFASGPVCWLGLFAVAAAMSWGLGSGPPFDWWIAALACSGVLGGGVLLWRHGASLVHPLRLSDLTRPGLPWRARLWLIFLPLTMVLPGGGLATPVWVWMRLRWWKRLVAARKALVMGSA